MKNKKKLPIALSVITLLLLASVVTSIILQDDIKTVTSDIRTGIENRDKPKFVFNTENFPDWATTGTSYINPKDITDDYVGSKGELPVSSITISQCENGSNCNKLVEKCDPRSENSPSCKELVKSTLNTHCFVSASYSIRTIKPDDEVSKYIEHIKSFDSIVVQEAGIKTLTMNTPEGKKEYKFHYYDYKNKGSDTIKRGNAIGYISLENGHIDVRSVCSETQQLDETLPVLAALVVET